MLNNLIRWRKWSADSRLNFAIVKELKENPNQDLFHIQKRHGLDGATLYFYLRSSGLEAVKFYRQEVEGIKNPYSQDNKDCHVMIVANPRNLQTKSQPKSIHSFIRTITDAGYTNYSIVDDPITSVLDGAIKIKSELLSKAEQKERIVLASFSHGSALTRFALDQLTSKDVNKVAAWFNFSGLVFGSPHYYCSDKKPMVHRDGPNVYRSFSCEQRYFIQPMRPKIQRIISFLGCRASWMMPYRYRQGYRVLSAWGPNDGLVPFRDYERMPGFVIPIWGQPHDFDFDSIRGILQKSLYYVVNQSKFNNNHEWLLSPMDFVGQGPKNEIHL